jgi:hypothetical protein
MEIPAMRNSLTGDWQLWCTIKGCRHTQQKPVVEVSAKGRDKPVMRYLPEVTSGTLPLEVSSSDTPLQKASSYSIPTEGESPRHSLRSSEAPPSEDKTVWMCWEEGEKSNGKPNRNWGTH